MRLINRFFRFPSLLSKSLFSFARRDKFRPATDPPPARETDYENVAQVLPPPQISPQLEGGEEAGIGRNDANGDASPSEYK